jgi:hypothetical protein
MAMNANFLRINHKQLYTKHSAAKDKKTRKILGNERVAERTFESRKLTLWRGPGAA